MFWHYLCYGAWRPADPPPPLPPGDSVLLLSGGIDSTTVLAQLVGAGRRPDCLIFDYGQTLQHEIAVAQANAARWRCRSVVVRLDLRGMAPDCAILGGVPLETGRTTGAIAAGGTPTSYVPFRNGIFLAYAAGYGEARGLTDLYCGGNGLASGNYWDDTTAFAAAMTVAAREGTAPSYTPTIRFPLAAMTKAEVVRAAWAAGVHLPDTFSCYNTGTVPCGACDSCVTRAKAVEEAALYTMLSSGFSA